MMANHTTMGWQFPPSFGIGGGKVALVADEKDIQQSLEILLSTLPGERLLHPEFGCDLVHFLFDEISQGLITNLKNKIMDAIVRYEPRIKVSAISIQQEDNHDGKLLIIINYIILATGDTQQLTQVIDLQEGKLNFQR